MGKWTELARQLVEEGEGKDARANSAFSANSSSDAPIGTIGTSGTASALPPEIVAGLERLKAEPGPKISNPAVWAEIVADAHRLADEGWASHALALGWSPLELWGASPVVGGDPYLDGLAVWLAGRRVVLIDERTAIVTVDGKRSTFTRPRQKGAVYLWDLFGIQRERNRGGVRK